MAEIKSIQLALFLRLYKKISSKLSPWILHQTKLISKPSTLLILDRKAFQIRCTSITDLSKSPRPSVALQVTLVVWFMSKGRFFSLQMRTRCDGHQEGGKDQNCMEGRRTDIR